ncbi:Atp-dependent dna helicase, partial [Thalictrum thalictroides]
CDRASLTVDGQYDEIAMTLQGRYICPIQAIWRLMGYTTHEEKPPVMLLPFHQEGMHRVAFNQKLSKEQVALAAQTQSSPFIDWMKYNAENEDGLDLLYGEFPSFYTHHKSRGWKKRKNGYSIGRMPLAVPRQGEHFYFRTLLTVKRGAKSFRDLYTVNGIYHEDPSGACRALGLVFDDSDWESLFEEVKDSSSASSLRQTFAAAIMHSAIVNPQNLWDRFKLSFTDDCLWQIRTLGNRIDAPPSLWTDEQCRFDFGLWLLEENLRHLGLDWKSARLTGPEHRWIVREANSLLAEALDFDRESEASMHASSINVLSNGQKAAYDTIVSSIESGLEENVFFLQGAAGTGKTFVYKTLCGLYRSQGKIVLCVASSGIAALLLPNGRTAHSLFRIPLDCPENAVCSIGGQDNLADLIRKTSLIIWDEVTMQQKNNFAAVDKSLRDIKKRLNSLFGGIPVLMGGDFAQILPVVIGGNREKIVTACIRSWSLWAKIKPLFLTENMRVIRGNANQRFAEWLARLSYDRNIYGQIEIPEWIKTTSDRKLFRNFIYPRRELEQGDTAIFEDRMVLTGLNESVDRFNKEIAEIRPSESREYIACDQVQTDESGQISDCPVEVLRTLQ